MILFWKEVVLMIMAAEVQYKLFILWQLLMLFIMYMSLLIVLFGVHFLTTSK